MSIESNNQRPETAKNSFKDSIKKITAKLLVGAALTAPMVAETDSEYDPGKQNSQEISTLADNQGKEDYRGETIERVSNMMFVSSLTANPNIEISLIPTDLINDLVAEKEQITLGKYDKELSESGCKPDYLKFANRWLNVVDNNNTGPFSLSTEINKNYEQVSDYIKREDVVRQVVEGDGLNEYEDGENKAMLVNMNEDDTNNFSEAMAFLKKIGIENPLDDLSQNGFNTFFLHKYDMGNYSWSSDGVISVHGDKYGELSVENAVKAMVEGGFANRLAALKDGAGVAIFGSYIDVLAAKLAAENLEYLYSKGGEENLEILVMATEFREKSERAMAELGRIKDDDQNVNFLYELVTQKNLVKAFGSDNWDFVSSK